MLIILISCTVTLNITIVSAYRKHPTTEEFEGVQEDTIKYMQEMCPDLIPGGVAAKLGGMAPPGTQLVFTWKMRNR